MRDGKLRPPAPGDRLRTRQRRAEKLLSDHHLIPDASLTDLRKGDTLTPRKIPDKGPTRALGVLSEAFRLPLGVQYSQGEKLPLGGFPGGEVSSDSAQRWISVSPGRWIFPSRIPAIG